MVSERNSLQTLYDYSAEEIRQIIDRGCSLKAGRLKTDPQVMRGMTGVMIFEKPSLRTRVTFEVAIHELGGHPIYLASDSVQMGKRESVDDVARNVGRWAHLIVARTYSHSTIESLAAAGNTPVINALSDAFHPCQALALGMTAMEHRPAKRIALSFIGDGNNVAASLMVLCAKSGWDFCLACPQGYETPAEVIEQCRTFAQESGATITIESNPHEAVKRADIIYTDVWTSMGQEDQYARRKKIFEGYQVNEELLAKAPSDALVSHCLPAHRGEEITAGVLDGPRSIALDEAENRLHVQKSVIVHLFTERNKEYAV